ncbi:MAG: hypothetical protein ACK4QW_18075, partial [Alphaproteobacteria bacterium]
MGEGSSASRRTVVLHGAVGPGAAPDDQDTLVQRDAVTAALAARGGTVCVVEIDRDRGGAAA